MKKSVFRSVVLLAMVTMPLAHEASGDGDSKLSINAVMHKQYTVSRAPFKRIKKELAADDPDWDKVREATKNFVNLATALEKNEPTSGEKESWTRFTKQHFGDAKAMDDAAEARDKAAILTVHRRVGDSCKACHQAHRFRGR
jgi:cytochrome c556